MFSEKPRPLPSQADWQAARCEPEVTDATSRAPRSAYAQCLPTPLFSAVLVIALFCNHVLPPTPLAENSPGAGLRSQELGTRRNFETLRTPDPKLTPSVEGNQAAVPGLSSVSLPKSPCSGLLCSSSRLQDGTLRLPAGNPVI